MLLAKLFEEFSGGPGASRLYIPIAPADRFHRFLIVPTLPFQILSQGVIEHDGGVLPVLLRVFFQLGLALWFDGD
jgi:hypothetical protein